MSPGDPVVVREEEIITVAHCKHCVCIAGLELHVFEVAAQGLGPIGPAVGGAVHPVGGGHQQYVAVRRIHDDAVAAAHLLHGPVESGGVPRYAVVGGLEYTQRVGVSSVTVTGGDVEGVGIVGVNRHIRNANGTELVGVDHLPVGSSVV